jgi:hypothetical protein
MCCAFNDIGDGGRGLYRLAFLLLAQTDLHSQTAATEIVLNVNGHSCENHYGCNLRMYHFTKNNDCAVK